MLHLDAFTYRWRLRPRGGSESRGPEEEVLGVVVCGPLCPLLTAPTPLLFP